MLKWVVKLNVFKENQTVHIVEAETGDSAIEKACEESGIEYNSHRQPTCSFQVYI